MEKESLSLAWVKDDQGWVLAVLDGKSLGELWLRGFIQETKIELDSSRDFGGETLSNTV